MSCVRLLVFLLRQSDEQNRHKHSMQPGEVKPRQCGSILCAETELILEATAACLAQDYLR